MLNVDPSILLAKKANRFGFLNWLESRDERTKKELFIRTLLNWTRSFSFPAKLILEDECYKNEFVSQFIFGSGLSLAIFRNPAFLLDLKEEELLAFDEEKRKLLINSVPWQIKPLDIRTMDDQDLILFIKQLSTYANLVVDDDRTKKRKFDESLSNFYPRYIAVRKDEDVKPSALVRQGPLKEVWRTIKKNEGFLFRILETDSDTGNEGIAIRRYLESLGFNNTRVFPNLNLSEECLNLRYLMELRERAFFEHLLEGKRSPEITRLLAGMASDRMTELKESSELVKHFVHRLKDPVILDIMLDWRIDSDPLFTLIRERLISLNYLGDKMPCSLRETFATQFAWLRLKSRLDPKQYSDKRLQRDKKLLKRISECGHSPFVIELFERGLIDKPPRNKTLKIAIYFARKGLIKSYNEIPSLRIEEYSELEFTLLEDGIALDDLRPIHLSRDPEDLFILEKFIYFGGLRKALGNEKILKRFLSSYKLFNLNALITHHPPNYVDSNLATHPQSISRFNYKIRNMLEGDTSSSNEVIQYEGADCFLEELEKTLKDPDRQIQKDFLLPLSEENIEKFIDFVERYYEMSQKTLKDELLKAILLRVIQEAEDGYGCRSQQTESRRFLSLDNLMDSVYPTEMFDLNKIVESWFSLKDFLKSQEFDLETAKKNLFTRLCSSNLNGFWLFLHERKLKIFGQTAGELLRKMLNEGSKELFDFYFDYQLTPILYDIGLYEADICNLFSSGPKEDRKIISILDPNDKAKYQLRSEMAVVNPDRKELMNDRSNNVLLALARVGALESPKFYELKSTLDSQELLPLNAIRNGSDYDLLGLIPAYQNPFDQKECMYLVVELTLRRQERARRVIRRLSKKKIRFKRRSIKNDPISKFIRSSMGKGRV